MDEETLKNLASQLRKPEGEEGIKTGAWMNKGNVHINLDTLEVVNPSGYDNILEIGMGNGFFVKEILSKHPSITYTGCDFSEVMISEAEKMNASWVAGGKAKFILTDAASLPFPDQSFDKIFTINTVYFWDDEVSVLKEISRVLKPTGKFILTLRPKHQMINYPFTKYGFKMYSKDDVYALLSRNGFIINNIFEKHEPDFELKGEVVKMESLIAEACIS
jgi:ubiquinone/menaquinone biosynthesis C-methylase UbiE